MKEELEKEKPEGEVGFLVSFSKVRILLNTSVFESKEERQMFQKNWFIIVSQQAALNELFQSIYSKANEDTRRGNLSLCLSQYVSPYALWAEELLSFAAMNKSFQTSGGTVLSTNWGDVGKADYEKERQAPAGMQWQTWEGDKLPQKDD